ncbi:MAG: hypothetical protein KDA46_14385 [Parvularculaceae bacterium]|nr:hypothetical protein [Parvularculaceae bacterium]
MSVADILDIIIILALVVAGGYGIVLNRRLNALRESHAEFHAALAGFDEATRQASQMLGRIEEQGLSRGAEIEAASRRAQLVLNELSVMTASGDHIAARIEDAVKDVRTLGAGKARKAA